MSYSVVIDTKAITRWAARVRADGQIEAQKFINLALKNSANIVQRRESQEAPGGTSGKLGSSIQQLVTTIAAAIGPDHKLDYPIYVEKGTKPHMPPVESITEWANSHGMNPWALAMSIKKKGTKANPFVERTYNATKNDVVLEFAKTTELITEFLSKA